MSNNTPLTHLHDWAQKKMSAQIKDIIGLSGEEKAGMRMVALKNILLSGLPEIYQNYYILLATSVSPGTLRDELGEDYTETALSIKTIKDMSLLQQRIVDLILNKNIFPTTSREYWFLLLTPEGGKRLLLLDPVQKIEHNPFVVDDAVVADIPPNSDRGGARGGAFAIEYLASKTDILSPEICAMLWSGFANFGFNSKNQACQILANPSLLYLDRKPLSFYKDFAHSLQMQLSPKAHIALKVIPSLMATPESIYDLDAADRNILRSSSYDIKADWVEMRVRHEELRLFNSGLISA